MFFGVWVTNRKLTKAIAYAEKNLCVLCVSVVNLKNKQWYCNLNNHLLFFNVGIKINNQKPISKKLFKSVSYYQIFGAVCVVVKSFARFNTQFTCQNHIG
jgi:hypothetical protein